MLDLFRDSEKLRAFQHALQEGEDLLIEELWNAPKALLAAIAQRTTGKNVLIITGASQEESKLYHDFAAFTDCAVVDFPAWETLPNENLAPSPDVVGERYTVLQEIAAKQKPFIILTGLQACLQRLMQPAQFNAMHLQLKPGDAIGYDDLIKKLTEMKYERRPVAADKGEFAVRGGIIDVFPVSSPDPFRIEFWGDEIESLRIYDPIGQKSVQQVQHATIPPAQEMEFLTDSAELSSLLDYLGPNTLIILDDLLALEDRYTALLSICGSPTRTFSSIEQFLDDIAPLQKMLWTQQLIEELAEVDLPNRKQQKYYSDSAPIFEVGFEMFNRRLKAHRWNNPFEPLAQYLLPDHPPDAPISGLEILSSLNSLASSQHSLELLCATEAEELNLQNRLTEAQVTLPAATHYSRGYLSSGLALPEIKLVILPYTEITHRYKIRRQKQRSTYHTTPTPIYDLTPGEIIVHFNNGIGRYLGMEKKPNNLGIPTEFFQIEYADNAKLYVPLNQAHLISKYIGATEEVPRIHTLGSNRWKNTREQTERAIIGYAKELLDLYAKREVAGGHIYGPDSADMIAFEEEFPFIETEDQLMAIEGIKTDMMSKKAMDRLVCGDVGYGKTEVAMRAAFKAVMDGRKQVAVLVPTTVLAMQHFENFVERMSEFPINIGVLSRFRSAKQIRETLEGVAKGSVDILIGTHRIISEDVIFKDLGLVIIDEEQRFGVKAKEHLKKIKTGVDCLTLSATPIPRTLYMSLIGARDMSTINTPPQDRLPITTMITEPNDLTIKNALMRELARDGQAYVIHNRVETIFDFAARIQKLLPMARIVVGHGQMHADEIDSVFHAFKYGRADILVATTIVENGIDIPNANTILIDRADHFGLADLYQLRGRVGRWNRRAYAYFLVKNQKNLPELTRKRLQALAEASGYGGGMKLAMRDLELRGAGDILGTEQSGNLSAIGFHFYCKLLKRTIKALQGKISPSLTDVKIDFPTIDARLPQEYIHELNLRMEIYQRLGETLSLQEVEEIWEEIHDRFGTPPPPAQWLYHLTRIRITASQKGYTLIKHEKLSLTLSRTNSTRTILLKLPPTPQLLESTILKHL